MTICVGCNKIYNILHLNSLYHFNTITLTVESDVEVCDIRGVVDVEGLVASLE